MLVLYIPIESKGGLIIVEKEFCKLIKGESQIIVSTLT
jgi:hypothetical protein